MFDNSPKNNPSAAVGVREVSSDKLAAVRILPTWLIVKFSEKTAIRDVFREQIAMSRRVRHWLGQHDVILIVNLVSGNPRKENNGMETKINKRTGDRLMH